MLLVLLFGICIRDVLGYCSGIGANPSFSGPPVVQQVLFIHTLIHTLCFVSRHVIPPARSPALGIQNIKFMRPSDIFSLLNWFPAPDVRTYQITIYEP